MSAGKVRDRAFGVEGSVRVGEGCGIGLLGSGKRGLGDAGMGNGTG